MVTRTFTLRRIAAGACAVSLALGACQVVLGIEEKSLEEQPGTDAGTGIDAIDESVDGQEEASVAWLRTPPPRPDGAAEASDAGRELVLAVRVTQMGSIEPATDTTTYEAWAHFGYDIDGLCTSADAGAAACMRTDGSTAASQDDGEQCRDNAVGRLISQAFKLLTIDYERSMHAKANAAEVPTLLIVLSDLDDGPDDPYVPAKLYVAVPRHDTVDPPPLWDGTDLPKVDVRSVINDSLDQPRTVFMTGYMKDHVWVSNDFGKSPMILPTVLFDDAVWSDMVTATITIELEPDHLHAKRSVVSGVATMAEVEKGVVPAVLYLANCDPNTAEWMLNVYFRTAADLTSGAPHFVNPSKPCDLASMAMELDWRPVRKPVEVINRPGTQFSCDAGLDQ